MPAEASQEEEEDERCRDACIDLPPVKAAKKYLKATLLNLLVIFYILPTNIAIVYAYVNNSSCEVDLGLETYLVTFNGPFTLFAMILNPWLVKKKLENISNMTMRFW